MWLADVENITKLLFHQESKMRLFRPPGENCKVSGADSFIGNSQRGAHGKSIKSQVQSLLGINPCDAQERNWQPSSGPIMPIPADLLVLTY